MGWPVHKKWYPDFSKVKRIIDVRVRLDLVVMLDFGRQRFKSRKFKNRIASQRLVRPQLDTRIGVLG